MANKSSTVTARTLLTTNLGPAIASTPDLLGLPWDVRNIIFKALFQGLELCLRLPANQRTRSCKALHILLVNHQLHDEARSVMLHETLFWVGENPGSFRMWQYAREMMRRRTQSTSDLLQGVKYLHLGLNSASFMTQHVDDPLRHIQQAKDDMFEELRSITLDSGFKTIRCPFGWNPLRDIKIVKNYVDIVILTLVRPWKLGSHYPARYKMNTSLLVQIEHQDAAGNPILQVHQSDPIAG